LKAGSVLLDLGANIGYFSLLGATLVQSAGKVISFEPNVQNLRLFHASIAANQFRNIVVFPLAASDTTQIHQLRAFGSNGYLQEQSQPSGSAQFVQAVPIDHILQAETRIDLVKMDIEGYEILALRGMRQTMQRHRPTLITEFNPWHIQHRSKIAPAQLLLEIEQLNYRLWVLDRAGAIEPTDTASLLNYWRGTNNDKMILDLLAEPQEAP
jgi:FkbM family methyltransferase